jgi:replication factor C subunit 1
VQDEAVQKVVEFMDTYCLTKEDFDTLVELSKFKVGDYSKSF